MSSLNYVMIDSQWYSIVISKTIEYTNWFLYIYGKTE